MSCITFFIGMKMGCSKTRNGGIPEYPFRPEYRNTHSGRNTINLKQEKIKFHFRTKNKKYNSYHFIILELKIRRVEVIEEMPLLYEKSGSTIRIFGLFQLQSCSKIIEKTLKIGIFPVSASNVKLFLETIWSVKDNIIIYICIKT